MFDDVSARERQMQSLDYNPCPYCGGNPRKEHVVAYVNRLDRVAGCCKPAVVQVVPGIDPGRIVEFSIKL